MIRPVIVVAALALGVSAVVAANDPIAERKDTMKSVGAATKTGAAMAKGEMPFDSVKAQEIFKAYQQAAQKFPALFPDNTKTGGNTEAAAKIWEDKSGFTAAAAKFEKDAADAASKAADLDGFKAAFGAVTKNCSTCHESFRMKKS
ncbi:cytochrome c [Chelatococcus sp. SYSU_G07232]|uniref:Cytochrome c n=1 Tax=Chelatococcus albus TaxID=3047466 RepID=A0ABT7AHQ6_9HYPH|nr:cytochrome c [Chelatococcus sp. SYSU_G07232]MDJ1158512.1 cytochrome c [Chelatococcus sp. SYSU_G07232]